MAALPLREKQALSAMHEHLLIAEYPAEYWLSDEWVLKLSSWCMLLGITQIPDKIEVTFLEEALINDFNSHSFAEIEVALKMCVMDEFSERIEAYNKLNLRFLALVMKQYRKFRKDVANKYEEIKFKIDRPAPKVYTDFELDINTGTEIWDDYIRVCNNIDIFGLSHKPDLLLKLLVLSSEEIGVDVLKMKEEIMQRDPENYKKDAKLRLEALQKDAERLDIHTNNVVKDKMYRQWLEGLKKAETTFEQFCDVVESKIFSYHSMIKQLPTPYT